MVELEASMRAKLNEMFQNVRSFGSDVEVRFGGPHKCAEEQELCLVVMLERHAAMDAMAGRSSEQVDQLKQSLDKARTDIVFLRDRHEQTLERTRWVVAKVVEQFKKTKRLFPAHLFTGIRQSKVFFPPPHLLTASASAVPVQLQLLPTLAPVGF